MTDNSTAIPDESQPVATGTVEERPASMSRRFLLRGASVAAPAILTLNSNTAVGWAIASGTIGTRAPTGGSSAALCLDKSTVGSEVKPGVFSLGDPPYGEVVSVPSTYEYQKYDVNWTGTPTPISPEQVCTEGGYLAYGSGGSYTNLQNPVNAANFALVSSTAVASFGSRIVTRSVTEL